jgi:myosin heavy subunit
MVDYARRIEQESTGFYVNLLKEHQEARGKIHGNRELSNEGKRKHIEKLKHEVKMMRKTETLRDEHDKGLIEAVKYGEQFITSKLPKVDETKRRLFELKAQELEGKILFATNAENARKALEELLVTADEPALAAEVRDKMAQLGTHVVNLATSPQDRLQTNKAIGRLFEEVSNRSLPEGAKEVRELMDKSRALIESHFTSPIVETSMREISVIGASYLYRPSEYFVNRADIVAEIEKE